MITSFDPTAAMSGTFDPQIANPCGRIYLFNESAVGLQLSFSDGSNASLPPYYFRSYYVARPGPVTWKVIYSIASGGSPLALVVGEAYESQEAKGVHFTEGPLNRQTSIGNSIPVGTSSTSIQNDGNAANTTVVESTVSGDGSSAVKLTNDGKLSLGNVTHPGSFSTDNGLIYSDGTGVLAIVTKILTNLMNAFPGSNFTINVPASQKIALQVNGTDVVDITGAGLTLTGSFVLSGAFSPSSIVASGNISAGSGVTLAGGDITMNGHNVNGAGAITVTGTITCGGGFTLNGGDIVMNSHDINGAGDITASGTVQGATVTSTGTMNCGGGFSLNGGDMHLGSHNIASSNNISTGTLLLAHGSFSRISKFTGTGSGNFSHGLGAGPDLILCNPCLLNGSSQTIGFGLRDATHVNVTTGAGFQWEALAIKF